MKGSIRALVLIAIVFSCLIDYCESRSAHKKKHKHRKKHRLLSKKHSSKSTSSKRHLTKGKHKKAKRHAKKYKASKRKSKRHRKLHHKSKHQNCPKKESKLKRLLSIADLVGLPYIPSNRSLSAPPQTGGIVTKGFLDLKFPSLPEPTDAPITINTPPSAYKFKKTKTKKVKPIVIVPEVIYPRKVTRVMMHHNYPFEAQMQQMMGKMNPVYLHMLKKHPYLESQFKKNKTFKALIKNKGIKKDMKAVDKDMVSLSPNSSLPFKFNMI